MEARQRGSQGASKSARGRSAAVDSIFASESLSGLKVSPKSIMVMSLIFIASVVMLHFVEKLRT